MTTSPIADSIHLPAFDLTTTEPDDPVVSKSEVLARAQLSRGALDKLLRAGYVGEPFRESAVRRLAAAPWVTTRPDSAAFYVIQTDVAGRYVEDPGVRTWRDWVGDAPWLSDADWLNAARGDWHNLTGAAARHYAGIVLGSFVTGILRFDDVDGTPTLRGTQLKWRFRATLVARLGPVAEGVHPLEDVLAHRVAAPGITEDERRVLLPLVGARIAPKAGPQVFVLR